MYDLILRDATILSSKGRQVADVAIKDGRIAYVGPQPPRNHAKVEISAIGKFLMPGVIDTAVQFDTNGDPELWERESRAAVTGGVTTVIALPEGEQPVIDKASALRRIARANGRSWCHFALWGDVQRGSLDDITAALDDRLIAGAMTSIGNGAGVLRSSQLDALLSLNGVFGVRLASNDRSAEGIEEIIGEARRRAKRVHLVALSTAEELQHLDPVLGEVPVTAGVTPHHLFLSTELFDAPVTTHPPVRPEQDRRTLWTAMKRGRLDCIASDHHPIGQASGDTVGLPGSELLFSLMLSAVKYGRLNLEMLVQLCSESPARIFGLEQKGRIARGADADLVLFSEGELTRIDDDVLLSSAGWSPYSDREAAPKPELVIVDGEIVARRGQLVANTPRGRHLLDN